LHYTHKPLSPLELGLAETVGWAKPAVVLFISYALFGLDAIGEEVEQPFGLDPNDLPLSTMSRAIEATLRQRIGEPPRSSSSRGMASFLRREGHRPRASGRPRSGGVPAFLERRALMRKVGSRFKGG
jgi:Bestrophin, RFP-TM, chloride channel